MYASLSPEFLYASVLSLASRIEVVLASWGHGVCESQSNLGLQQLEDVDAEDAWRERGGGGI